MSFMEQTHISKMDITYKSQRKRQETIIPKAKSFVTFGLRYSKIVIPKHFKYI